MKIGLAGVGGIGSNVALNLVRSGISSLKIVDFDRIESSNLNRQFYFHDQIGQPKVHMLAENLRRIRPQVKIEAVLQHISPENIGELFAACPIIVEGFDSVAAKKMLLERFAGTKELVVSASGIAGSGCDSITRRKLGNCFVVGDFVNDCHEHDLYAHKVVAVAAIMSELILNHIQTHE